MCSSVTASSSIRPASAALRLLELAFELGDHAIGELARTAPIAPALHDLELGARLVELLLELLCPGELVLLGAPLRSQLGRALLEVFELLDELFEAIARGRVALLLQRLALDLQLDDAAVELVDRLGLGIDLHAQPRGGLVHQIDRLVRQKAIGDVAVRQGGGGDDRRVGDAHAVMQLVFLLDAAQDRDRVLDRGLVDKDRLEAPRQCGVLLNVLAVFVERGGADAVQFAAGQCRLQHVGGIHRPFRLAGADEGVQLVDEEDDFAGRGGDLGQHRLQALLEFAAVFGASDHCAEIERQEPLVLEAFGHVAVDDPEGEALDDRGLADPGLADQHRVVLGPARQNLHRAADFLVPTDHRVELTFAGYGSQIASIALERVVAFLGRSTVGLAAFAQILDSRVELLRRHPTGRERLAGGRLPGQRQCEQQPLDGNKAVACLLRDLFGLLEDPGDLGREINLPGAAALDPRLPAELGLDGAQDGLWIAARRADQVGAETFLVFKQDLEEMLGCEALMATAQRQTLGRLDESLRPLGIFFEFHDALASLNRPQRSCSGSPATLPEAIWCGRCGAQPRRTQQLESRLPPRR